MANIAQLINCLQSLFVAHEDKFIVTPNYHVFDMYMDHMGAEAVRTEFVAPRVSYTRNGQPATFWGLAGSASRKDKTRDADRGEPERGPAARGGDRRRRRARSRAATARTLADAEARLAQLVRGARRRAVAGRANGTRSARRSCSRFPPASVTKLKLTIGLEAPEGGARTHASQERCRDLYTSRMLKRAVIAALAILSLSTLAAQTPPPGEDWVRALQRQGPDRLGRGRQGEMVGRKRHHPWRRRDAGVRLPEDREELRRLPARREVPVRGRRQQRRVLPHRLQAGHGRRLAGPAVRGRLHDQQAHRRHLRRRARVDRVAGARERTRGPAGRVERVPAEGRRQPLRLAG